MSLLVAALIAVKAAAPGAAVPAMIDPQQCEDPVARKAVLASDPADLPALREIRERAAANEQRMTALVDRLADRAKWTSDDKFDFTKKMFSSPELSKLMERGFGLLETMMGQLESVMSSNDELKNCRAVVGMVAMIPAIDDNAQEQWAVMRTLVEAEAKRLNVALD